MRLKKDNQGRLNFKPDLQPAALKITRQFQERYEAIGAILDATPGILNAVHRDLTKTLDQENRSARKQGRKHAYTSEMVMRMSVVFALEGVSLRRTTVRIDDSIFLRQWVKIHPDEPMMSFSVFSRLHNSIQPSTWEKINGLITEKAIADKKIQGDKLRLDTTAVETNIHWPSDSGLLYDTYRVLARIVRNARKLDPSIDRSGNIQTKHAKKIHTRILRSAGKKRSGESTMQRGYKALFGLVEKIFGISDQVARDLKKGIEKNRYGILEAAKAEAIVLEIEHFRTLGDKVIDQAKRRVLNGETVPTNEKIFSIFEPHTDMLIRGKRDKEIEFGHMIQLHQVGSKFITGYDVFEKRVPDNKLVDDAVKRHDKLFGCPPKELAADKGYYESMSKIRDLERDIKMVSIAKKGSRTAEEIARESEPAFKLGQAFRAGIEGTISFLKRSIRLLRCFRKGWKNFQSEVGRAIFVHNLLVLVRGSAG